jgi:hypothetical protein
MYTEPLFGAKLVNNCIHNLNPLIVVYYFYAIDSKLQADVSHNGTPDALNQAPG